MLSAKQAGMKTARVDRSIVWASFVGAGLKHHFALLLDRLKGQLCRENGVDCTGVGQIR
jgi:hypothetical protein